MKKQPKDTSQLDRPELFVYWVTGKERPARIEGALRTMTRRDADALNRNLGVGTKDARGFAWLPARGVMERDAEIAMTVDAATMEAIDASDCCLKIIENKIARPFFHGGQEYIALGVFKDGARRAFPIVPLEHYPLDTFSYQRVAEFRDDKRRLHVWDGLLVSRGGEPWVVTGPTARVTLRPNEPVADAGDAPHVDEIDGPAGAPSEKPVAPPKTAHAASKRKEMASRNARASDKARASGAGKKGTTRQGSQKRAARAGR